MTSRSPQLGQVSRNDIDSRPALLGASAGQTRQIGTKAQAASGARPRTVAGRLCAELTYAGPQNAGAARHCPGRGYVRYNQAMAANAQPPTTSGEAVAEDGIEFLFAQFVDMHAKPSAKLVPAQQLEGLLTDGAGFAGFAAGDIGQTPDNPDLIAMPDVGSFTRLPWKPEIGWFACDATVEGEAWPYCPRTILRRQVERAREAGFEFKIGCRARVLPRPPDRGRRDRDRRPARHARAALLRHPRAHALVRLRRRRRPARELARLGDVRDRPRGRQRTVRAELRLRRRAHDLRPGGLLPLHGRGAGPGARA